MLPCFVDLDAAGIILGWSVEKIVEMIKGGELTAYARIHCGPHDDSTLDDSYDDDEKYEIARITNLKEKPNSQSPGHTEWFFVHYEPIGNALEKNERESECYDANLASDNYCGQRVFGYLKSRSSFQDLVSKDQICLLNSNIKRCLPGDIEAKVEQIQSKKVSAPDVTGRKGAIKTMVFEGLQAFYVQKQRLPEEGNAFQEFLDFIYIQINQKTRPDYLAQIVSIVKTGTETSNCITIKGVKRPKNRKYVSTEFYKFKKDFAPQVTTEAPAHP